MATEKLPSDLLTQLALEWEATSKGSAELGKREATARSQIAMVLAAPTEASPAATREFFSAVRLDVLNNNKELLQKLLLTEQSVAVSAIFLFLLLVCGFSLLGFCSGWLRHVTGWSL